MFFFRNAIYIRHIKPNQKVLTNDNVAFYLQPTMLLDVMNEWVYRVLVVHTCIATCIIIELFLYTFLQHVYHSDNGLSGLYLDLNKINSSPYITGN